MIPRHQWQFPRGESDQPLAESGQARRIENWLPTREGTLRTVHGPTPYLPFGVETAESQWYGSGDMTDTHGVFHCTLDGGSVSLLVVHDGDRLLRFDGHKPGWRPVVEDIGGYSTPFYRTSLSDSSRPQPPTQFVATPVGLLIFPYRRRPMILDQHVCAPLGYSEAPSPPEALGPESSTFNQDDSVTLPTTTDPGINNQGYAHDAQAYMSTGVHPTLGLGRKGTIQTQAGAATTGGVLLPGEIYYATQLVDRWGNLSPISPRSNAVKFRTQLPRWYDSSGSTQKVGNIDQLLKWVGVTGIATGPAFTAGRNLLATRDTKNSGTTKLFEIPTHNGVGGNIYTSTIPDNLTTFYSDNVSDARLIVEATEVDPVPPYVNAACMAFQRVWIAYGRDVRASMVGRYGTFTPRQRYAPDPSDEVVALHPCPGGMLALTKRRTFLFTENDQGTGFHHRAIRDDVGIVGPSAICTTADGQAVWLDEKGIFTFDGQTVTEVAPEKRPDFQKMNKTRAIQSVAVYDHQYRQARFWFPYAGSNYNNMCFAVGEGGITRFTHMTHVSGATTMKLGEPYTIVCGKDHGAPSIGGTGTYDSVWVLDHEGAWTPSKSPSVLKASWEVPGSGASFIEVQGVSFYLKERYEGTSVVVGHHDWRDRVNVKIAEDLPARIIGEQSEIRLYTTADAPYLWDGTTSLDEASSLYRDADLDLDKGWHRSRPYTYMANMLYDSVECASFTISTTDPAEFIAYAWHKLDIRDPSHTEMADGGS